MKSFIVDETHHRERADNFACKQFPDLSRAYVQRLLEQGDLTVNGEQAKSGLRLKAGDELELHIDLADVQKIEDIDLPILYQDDDVVVINKPTGVISHSRGKYWYEPSVASFMRQVSGQEGERSGIVHRLDRATSGVMICAKNQSAMKVLQKQFADRTVQKTYIAIINGNLDPAEAIIDLPIERNPKKPQTFRVGPQGKSAQTYYKVLQTTDTLSMIELKPKTGRTHQLRVHLAHLKHPIVGDELYDGPEAERLMLHAHTLTIKLPNGTEKEFTAPLPNEFKSLMGSAS